MIKHKSIDELLSSKSAYYVWVLSYAISMGRNMWLAVHEGGFVDRVEVLAKGCTYWRGPLEAGPWILCVEQLPDGTLKLFDRGGGFELICDSLQLVEPTRIQI